MYYYFSIPCNPVKQHLFVHSHPVSEAKADAKVQLFSETPKLFREKFRKTTKILPKLIYVKQKQREHRAYTLLYIGV